MLSRVAYERGLSPMLSVSSMSSCDALSRLYNTGRGVSPARRNRALQTPEDLEQQCYMELWEELADDGRTFLFLHFAHALRRLRGHVAHNMMQRAGCGSGRGVRGGHGGSRASLTDRSLAVPEGEDGVPLVDQVPDASAEDVFDQAELSDLFALVMTLPADQRMIIFDQLLGWYRKKRRPKSSAFQIGWYATACRRSCAI